MGKRKLYIVFDGQNQVYFPGQQILGRVVLETDEEMKARCKYVINDHDRLCIETIAK